MTNQILNLAYCSRCGKHHATTSACNQNDVLKHSERMKEFRKNKDVKFQPKSEEITQQEFDELLDELKNGKIKQVIVVRTDLNMRKGKMCSQVAHASMKVILDKMSCMPSIAMYNGEKHKHFSLIEKYDSPISRWIEESFTKIVVGCNSEEELFELQRKANEMKIVNALILDNGNTEFKEDCDNCGGKGFFVHHIHDYNCNICKGTGKINKPTYTCLAIGPDYSDKIDKITGGLKLL